MSDQSHLNRKYFLDDSKYNCPFCNRHSVTYSTEDIISFNWSEDRIVYIYLIKCGGCSKISVHFSNFYFPDYNSWGFKYKPYGIQSKDYDNKELDKYFFHHQPTSFFTLNSLIPKSIRELVSEADGCRKMNFLVGASGALRKAIYEFIMEQKAEGESYQGKIKWLKTKYPQIYPEYFDALANIQDMTSESLHEKEGSWEPWDNDDISYLVEVVKAILDEVYVKPEERKNLIASIGKLKQKTKSFQATDELVKVSN